jgi:hypothetical protein
MASKQNLDAAFLTFSLDENRGKVMATVEDKSPWNSFTEHFLDCARGTLSDFHPKQKAQLSYTLYL